MRRTDQRPVPRAWWPTPAAAFASASLAVALAAAPALAQPTCIACHRQRAEAHLRAPVDALRSDVHGEAGLGCVDCHGGDASEPTMRAHAFAGGFVGAGEPLAVVTVCGRCHDGSREDAAAVLAEFRAGAHGRALAAGSHVAATCTSCHGAHGVRPTGDAAALTERTHVAALCGTCHADRERLGEAELRTDVVAEYEASVHGVAVREGDPIAPTCAGCHGPHQNAAGLHATLACASCHLEIRAAFDEGPHAEAFGRLGFSDCAECHGSHDVVPASEALLVGLEATCLACHDRSSPVLDRVRALQALGGRLEGLRRTTERDDPRRREAILAFHRLDQPALAAALEGVPEAVAEEPSAPASSGDGSHTGSRTGSSGSGRLALAGLALVVALIAALLLVRSRRPR